jgi:predicted nucleic acid-binding protein
LAFIERTSLDLGEAAAIGLALRIKADLLLIDERNGRRAARNRGLPVSGVLGELLHAKNRKWISAVRPEIVRLRTEARFFVSLEIEEFVLKTAGE